MPACTLSDVMTADPACCTPEDGIADVARMMVSEDCGAIPVVESKQNRRLVGIVTDRDLVVRIMAKDLDASRCQVRQAMTENPSSLSPDTDLNECMERMATEQVRRMPVTDRDGRLVGIVAQADLARASNEQPDMQDEMADMVEEVSSSNR